MSAPERRGACPQCGAPIAFPFAHTAAQVCRFCRFLVVPRAGDFTTIGKVADLLPLDSPLFVDATGRIGTLSFRVAGRVQYDRVGAASAPWQEFFLQHGDGGFAWLAQAQGSWFHTWPVAPGAIPSWQEALPGALVAVPNWPPLSVTERGQRQMISAEGELPFVRRPAVVEWYADLSGPGGVFATIDYGDGTHRPDLFAGKRIDPRELVIDAPSPAVAAELAARAPQAKTTALACPSCQAPLSLVSPMAVRVVCKYCGAVSDLSEGALSFLKAGQKRHPKIFVPLGKAGKIRGIDVVCVGFMERGTTVDGDRYRWREYLLYAPALREYRFLLEEDGDWQFIAPIAAGDLKRGVPGYGRDEILYENVGYAQTQSVAAEVEHVLGEFYWKVEIGETVQATEYGDRGGGRKLSEERSRDEVVWSHSTASSANEIREAFDVDKKTPEQIKAKRHWLQTWFTLLGAWFAVTMLCIGIKEGRVIFNQDLPPALAGAATSTFFSAPFNIDESGRSLFVELSCEAANTWAAADIALVNETTGDVEETSLDVEYYSGVEGGESWSEGNTTASAWFSRLPVGRYLIRAETSTDPANPVRKLSLRAVHNTWSGATIFASLGLLVAWLIVATWRWGRT